MSLCECGCGQPAPIASKNDRSTNRVKGQPMRFVVGHASRRYPETWIEEDRGFETPCWIWQGRKIPTGYGITRAPDGRRTTAHLAVYERFIGPVPDGLELDHRCRQRDCVNHSHVEPVTHAENMRRGSNCKLTIEDARAIRGTSGTCEALGRMYGVDGSTISLIRRNRIWREDAAA
jgi:hypothetical protein